MRVPEALERQIAAYDRNYFILSSAGKPIYSLHGNDDELTSFVGLIQAIVSFCEDAGDEVQYVTAGKYRFVFLIKGSIFLLCVTNELRPIPFSLLQLQYLYNQIVFILTSRGLGILDRKVDLPCPQPCWVLTLVLCVCSQITTFVTF